MSGSPFAWVARRAGSAWSGEARLFESWPPAWRRTQEKWWRRWSAAIKGREEARSLRSATGPFVADAKSED